MYEIIVDKYENLNQYGSSFFFDTLEEAIEFIQICFESNKDREEIVVKKIEDR